MTLNVQDPIYWLFIILLHFLKLLISKRLRLMHNLTLTIQREIIKIRNNSKIGK